MQDRDLIVGVRAVQAGSAAPTEVTTLASAGAATTGPELASGLALDVPPERPGQYTRLNELGRGSQSVVRAARDQIVEREVALKELSRVAGEAPDGDAYRAARARFLREVRLIASLEHPGIVAIHELAQREDGTLFCAQKLIRGETLRARIARTSSLDERLLLLRHIVDACHAVAYAHDKRIIHRDLKPSNVMVGEYGETVVVDWGLAKRRDEEDVVAMPGAARSQEPALTVAGIALGTPAYMSPEQARGELAAIDERSDVFSLGAILYELLTGRSPFEGETAEQVMVKVRAGSFPAVRALVPEAPAELAAIAERALRPLPAERYANGEALAKELSAYVSGGRVGAYRYGVWELLRKFASSHRALLSGAAIAVGAVVIAATVVAMRLHQARLDLASSFLERGYGAERDGDWASAAAYFAGARAQHDTREARWALAVASERITERIVSLTGPAESLTDVAALPDGRIISLGLASDRVEIRDVDSGKTLWTRSGDSVLTGELLPGGRLRLTHGDRWDFRDAATGDELTSWPRARGYPCPGPFPPPVVVLDGQLLRRDDGHEPRVLAPDAGAANICVVSDDGRQVAYQDTAGLLRLLAVEDGRELARRKSERFHGLHFTPHGLVIFRGARLDVLGGPDGDFIIDLPEARSGIGSSPPLFGGSAVSPDGELAAIGSREAPTRAVVVDLRSRSIRGILHYAPGWPRLAFSRDGQRVFAAGMDNASVLSGWRMPPVDMPSEPRWWSTGTLSRSGGTSLLWDDASGRFELQRPPGTLAASGVCTLSFTTRLVGDLSRAAFIASESTVVIHDLETDRVLWQQPCRLCKDISVSDDGSRFAQVGADGLEVWDTRTQRRLFQETRRARPFTMQTVLSGDGRLLAWTFVDTLVVRDLDSEHELTVPLDGMVRGIRFGPDAAELIVVTTRSATLWAAATGQQIWSVANELPDMAVSHWSPDGRAIIVNHGWHSTQVFDAGTGERLAWFQTLSRPVSPVAAELYAADLRVKAVAAEKTWEIRSVPPPDEAPADDSLTRTLKRTGLAFRGVEVIAAP
jgi:WD40 repeat protein